VATTPSTSTDALTSSVPESPVAGEADATAPAAAALESEDVSTIAPEPPEEISGDAAAALPAEDLPPSPPARPAAAPAAAEKPLGAGGPKVDDARPRPQPAPPAPPKRGPTKVRLLPIPDALYRTIEHGARESRMTIAAYLNALIEIARAAVGADASGRPRGGEAVPGSEEGPSIAELFAQVQEAQAVELGSRPSSDETEQSRPSD
jgi:hypothetical protein